MKISRILSIAAGTLVLGSGALFAQAAPGAGKEARGAPGEKRIERPERETAEMREKRARNHQFRVDMINLMVRNGKMEKAHGDYLINRLRNEKAFKDANPEWVKYDRMARFAPGRQGFDRRHTQGARMAPNHRFSCNQGKCNQGKKDGNWKQKRTAPKAPR
jgi:hypothetical protein